MINIFLLNIQYYRVSSLKSSYIYISSSQPPRNNQKRSKQYILLNSDNQHLNSIKCNSMITITSLIMKKYLTAYSPPSSHCKQLRMLLNRNVCATN